MGLRFVHGQAGDGGRPLVRRMARLSKSGDVLVISARIPTAALRDQLHAEGADLGRVFLLDASGHAGMATPQDRSREAHVSGPAQLELITQRILRAARNCPGPEITVMVDDVATFMLHNPPGVLEEIVRYDRVIVPPSHWVDYVFSGVEPPIIAQRGRSLVDEECDLLDDGTLVRQKRREGPSEAVKRDGPLRR